MDVGDVIRPKHKDYNGVEDLIVKRTENGNLVLVRMKCSQYCAEEKENIFEVRKFDIKEYAIFIRKATKAELVLYGTRY